MTHRKSTIRRWSGRRPSTPDDLCRTLLASAAEIWVAAHPLTDERYSSVENGFLRAAETAFFDALPSIGVEVLVEQAQQQHCEAIRTWRHAQRHVVSGTDRHFVYWFWAGATCRYVGVSSRLLSRLREHETRFDDSVDRVSVQEFDSRLEAELHEANEIFRLQPEANVAGKDAARPFRIG